MYRIIFFMTKKKLLSYVLILGSVVVFKRPLLAIVQVISETEYAIFKNGKFNFNIWIICAGWPKSTDFQYCYEL